MMKKYLPFLLLLIIFSCKEDLEIPEISMPATPIMTGISSWGVVNVSYLKISRSAADEQHIVTTLRKGDLVEIESIHYIGEGQSRDIWYNISKDNLNGWVHETSLNCYSTKEKAKTASLKLLANQ